MHKLVWSTCCRPRAPSTLSSECRLRKSTDFNKEGAKADGILRVTEMRVRRLKQALLTGHTWRLSLLARLMMPMPAVRC